MTEKAWTWVDVSQCGVEVDYAAALSDMCELQWDGGVSIRLDSEDDGVGGLSHVVSTYRLIGRVVVMTRSETP